MSSHLEQLISVVILLGPLDLEGAEAVQPVGLGQAAAVVVQVVQPREPRVIFIYGGEETKSGAFELFHWLFLGHVMLAARFGNCQLPTGNGVHGLVRRTSSIFYTHNVIDSMVA